MKILFLNTNEKFGGAAIAAHRLYSELKKTQYNIYYLVLKKISDDHRVIKVSSLISKIGRIFNFDDLILSVLGYKKEMIFSSAYFSLMSLDQMEQQCADIVHFHWINLSMINVNILSKIKQPVIWTLHDAWLFTGGCHVLTDCIKYKTECGNCPRLHSNRKNDLSNWNFKRKLKVIGNLTNLTIICPSNWLADCAKKSTILGKHDIRVIPNGIDTNVFKPVDKILARQILNIPLDKKVLTFGAVFSTQDTNKGFHLLEDILKNLNKKDSNILLSIFGSDQPKVPFLNTFEEKYFGHLNDAYSLVLLYSASDVILIPSKSENLPNIILESMACGTPVVAFNIGGISDIVDHKMNGYLAKPYDVNDFVEGIIWLLSNNCCDLKALCRDKIISDFNISKVAKSYINLYNDVLKP